MKWKTASLITIVLCFVGGLVFWLDDSSKQTLPDGTVLVMSGVKIGRTNVYTHGTWLSKTLGCCAPDWKSGTRPKAAIGARWLRLSSRIQRPPGLSRGRRSDIRDSNWLMT